MHNLKIIEIPYNLKRILNKSDLEISFHSKYKKTINFNIDSKIIAFQDSDLPLTPYSIKTNNFNSNVDVQYIQDLLKLSLNKEHKLVDLKIDKKISIDKVILRKNLNSFLLSKVNRSEILSAIFSKSINNHFSGIIIDPETNFNKFVGLGNGLTPAGDDFIIGFILGKYLLKKVTPEFKEKLRRTVNVKNATNDISRQFLNAAIDGYFNEFIIELVNSVKDNKPIISLLSKISEIGASSGLDLLAGLYLSLK
jgi:hypothetical protein